MQFTELELPCALTDEEVESRGRMLGETIWAIGDTQTARTAAMKESKERLVGLNEMQRKLARVIRNRVENRMVRCVTQYHMPGEGMKRTLRMDTGEVVREEQMTDSEKQLNLFAAQQEFEKFMQGQSEAPPSDGADRPGSDEPETRDDLPDPPAVN